MTAHRIPFVFPLPASGWASQGSSLSQVRAWATSQVMAHARRTGTVMQGQPYGFDYDTVDEEGRPAVACVAVLATRPTIADAVAELRARPAKALREHRCLVCEGIRRLRATGIYSDADIAARLELQSATHVQKHIDTHGRNGE